MSWRACSECRGTGRTTTPIYSTDPNDPSPCGSSSRSCEGCNGFGEVRGEGPEGPAIETPKPRLWVLRPKKRWSPWADKVVCFVVRATTETEARDLASKEAGDEGAEAWKRPLKTTCEPLLDEGEIGVVIRDFAVG